jgi:hypothetical protein
MLVDKRMFLMAALQEISGKERKLVTEPEYAGSLLVIQTLLDVAAGTITQEVCWLL